MNWNIREEWIIYWLALRKRLFIKARLLAVAMIKNVFAFWDMQNEKLISSKYYLHWCGFISRSNLSIIVWYWAASLGYLRVYLFYFSIRWTLHGLFMFLGSVWFVLGQNSVLSFAVHSQIQLNVTPHFRFNNASQTIALVIMFFFQCIINKFAFCRIFYAESQNYCVRCDAM